MGKKAKKRARMQDQFNAQQAEFAAALSRMVPQEPPAPSFITLTSGETFFGFCPPGSSKVIGLSVNSMQVNGTLFGNFLMADDEGTLVETSVGDIGNISVRSLTPAQKVEWRRINSLYRMAMDTARTWATRQCFMEILDGGK